ncbi:MAG: ABC transporter permease, partial [bacterium]|nr:ABC transporter permease [bacterium]
MTDASPPTHHTPILPPDGEETGPAISPLRPGDDPSSIAVASQWTLIRHRFFRNKVAVGAGIVVIFFYFVALFVEFLAPTDPTFAQPRFTYAPPQTLSFFVETEQGREWLPHVKGYTMEVDQESLRRTFTVDENQIIPIGLFVEGRPYEL